jgi:hypothetical protein
MYTIMYTIQNVYITEKVGILNWRNCSRFRGMFYALLVDIVPYPLAAKYCSAAKPNKHRLTVKNDGHFC